MNTKRQDLLVAGSTTLRPNKWVRLAIGGLLLVGLAAGVAPLRAQSPPTPVGAGGLPDKTYMNKSAISLPVIVEERARACLKEIQLYVKDGSTGPWQKVQTVAPSATGFEYRMPHDGEYWYNVVTVDLSNVATPPDVSKELPAVIVVLDTSKPQVDLKPLPPCCDGVCVKCDVQDANPNPLQTKFEYQTMNQAWWPVEALPNQPECYCVPRQAALSGMVKVTCVDRAMNSTVREFNMNALGLTTLPADVAGGQPKATTPPVTNEVSKLPTLPPTGLPTPPVGTNVGMEQTAPSVAKKPQDLPPQGPELPAMPQPGVSHEAARPVTHAGAKWLMVNQPRVSMDFTIEDAGKNGVGKVTIWITKDHGQTWDVHSDVTDKKSPAVFDLPGEGVYGFRVVVTNSRGFGGGSPKSGESPEFTVELDTTKPRVALGQVKLGPISESACIDISWQAEDKNLGATPIDILYSTSPQGPWAPIVKGVANTGRYRWFLPQEIGRQAYVRVVATDMAGNSTRTEVSDAIALDDGTRPVARIGSIIPVSQGMGPIGN